MVTVSIIICTYNPVRDIFKKCLQCIDEASGQTGPGDILIIDNNSSVPLEQEDYIKEFLSRHTQARLIRETKQGLTNARLRGIKESKGGLLIFIDDDNFIAPNFIQVAAQTAAHYSFIGSFSGQVTLEYDKEPPAWTKKYWGMLVHKQFTGNYWSNLLFNNDTMPCGAGLCVTKEVADYYLQLHENGKRNFYLDRTGNSLLSGGDNDLAMCACDIGKGMGLFQDLQVRHRIPGNRFTLQYLSRLAHGIYYSSAVLQYLRTGKIEEERITTKLRHFIRKGLLKRHDRVIQDACRKGLIDAQKMLKSKKIN